MQLLRTSAYGCTWLWTIFRSCFDANQHARFGSLQSWINSGISQRSILLLILSIDGKLYGLVGKPLLIAYNKIVGKGAALLAAPTEEEEPTPQDFIESELSKHDVDWEEENAEQAYGKIIDEVFDENGETNAKAAEVQLQKMIGLGLP